MTPAQSLPPGWRWTTLGEIADLKGGLTKGKKRKEGDRLRSVPYLRVANVQRGYLDLDEMKLIEATEAEIEGLRLRAGDVLFNEGGDRDKLGRGWIWQDALLECIHQNHVFRARLRDPAIEPKFISWYANSEGAAYFNDQGRQTTNLASINLTRLSEFPLPLAPASEQRRIVAEIESQFTRLDAAVSGLRRAMRNLRRFRAAVFASAISGKLVPPRSRWRTIRVEEAGEVKLGRQRAPQHQTGDHIRPYLRVANVFEDRIDTSDVLQMNFTPAEFETFKLEPGDVLLNEGQSLELVGRAAIYRGEVPGACFQNTLIRFRSGPDIRPEFALVVFRAYLHAGEFRRVARWTTSIAHLGANRLAAMTIPLPPRDEQDAIVEEVERRLSIAENMERVIDGNLRRAARLRQSILKSAFEGSLVPQDRNDEPADELLAAVQSNGRASSQRAVRKGAR